MRITTDRLLVGVLALLGAGALSVAIADPPAAPAAAAPTATPNAAAAQAAKPAASETPDAAQAAEEKRLLAAGYKPEMRNGTKYWCRSEQEQNSRFTHKVCGTADQIKLYARDGAESTSAAQLKQVNPTGR
jgi:hypothetical protein